MLERHHCDGRGRDRQPAHRHCCRITSDAWHHVAARKPGTVRLMRTLATSVFGADAVETALRASTGVIGCRFDVLDNNLSIVGTLDDLVTAASVEMNVDRTIKGSLTLRMLPATSLVDMLFQRRIRPVLQIGMPGGLTAEYTMGVYVWNTPSRSRPDGGAEVWDIVLGDQMHVLDAGGPGINGWTVASGTAISSAIQ